VQDLLSLLKSDFATVRELEKKSYKLFAYSAGAFVIGLLLFLTALLAFVGVPLMLFGVALLFMTMIWMIRLSNRPVWDLYCPYCASKNDVFKSHEQFHCDICGKPVRISEYGEPIPVEPIGIRRIRNHG
jgi:hypothetical protein